MSFSTHVRFHATIIDIVESLHVGIEENNTNELGGVPTIDVVGVPHDAVNDGDSNGVRRRHKSWKDGVVPQSSSHRFKAFLPLAAAQLCNMTGYALNKC